MSKKHPNPFELDSVASRERNAESVAAALELLKNGTAHMAAEIVEGISDDVGRGLCNIGVYTHPVSPSPRLGKGGD